MDCELGNPQETAWLERVSVREWQRWCAVSYFEVIYSSRPLPLGLRAQARAESFITPGMRKVRCTSQLGGFEGEDSGDSGDEGTHSSYSSQSSQPAVSGQSAQALSPAQPPRRRRGATGGGILHEVQVAVVAGLQKWADCELSPTLYVRHDPEKKSERDAQDTSGSTAAGPRDGKHPDVNAVPGGLCLVKVRSVACAQLCLRQLTRYPGADR